MAAIAEMPIVADPVPTKRGRSRKALKQKNSTSNEANILAGTIPEPSPVAALPEDSAGKENHESLSNNKTLSVKKTKKGGAKAKKDQDLSLEKALQEMQEKLQQLSLEKQQTEEILKAKEEVLKQKEEELETRGAEQEKLQMELKKLQKMKEFKPTMSFPILPSFREKEQGNKEKKKKGDPARKKPSPAYVLWCKDQWIEVKKANPDADFKEVSALLGAKWKTITAEEKKPYEERYQAEKEAYLKIAGNEKREHEAMKLLEEEHKQKTAMELLEQYMQFVQEAEGKTKKSKKEKDPLKPKQPMSAFFMFSNERRAALSNKNVKEVAKIMGEEWRNMTEAQKAPYEEMALKNRERYFEEMKLYNEKKEEENANIKREEEEMIKLQKQEALQLLKKKEKTENLIKKTKQNQQKNKKQKEDKKNAADPNKPKRPASSFFLFSKEERKKVSEERPGISNSTVNALISVKWKELSEEEKQAWNDKAAAAMEIYKKELEEYNKSIAESSSS